MGELKNLYTIESDHFLKFITYLLDSYLNLIYQ